VTTSPSGSVPLAADSLVSAIAPRTAWLCAETALFMRDYVLSLASHDLRSPLNAIHSWAYVLERKIDAGDATGQRALGGIRTGVDQQVKLLESVVDRTRAATRALTLTAAPFVPRALIDETVAEAKEPLASVRNVALAIESPLAGETLNGDRLRLGQALWLMLTFAIEASASGASVTLSSAFDASVWRTTVGFVVQPAMLDDPSQPHLLEPFARSQAREPREGGRVAWVLALCKRVAEAHNGGFEQSDLQEGQPATLTLTVPLAGG
jgi:signal transduction histidine kinase